MTRRLRRPAAPPDPHSTDARRREPSTPDAGAASHRRGPTIREQVVVVDRRWCRPTPRYSTYGSPSDAVTVIVAGCGARRVGEHRDRDQRVLDERLGQAPPGRPPRAAGPGRARPAPAHRRPRARARRARPSRRARATAAPLRPSSLAHAARTTAGGHSLASRSRTASRKASWSSVNAKRIGESLLPRAGRARARRRRCAGSRWCRRRSGPTARTGSPSSTRPVDGVERRRARRAEQLERGLVQAHVELGPEDLGEARLGRPARSPLDDAGDGARSV